MERKYGNIVNISSQASLAALPDHLVYCASKAALDSLTRVMALDYGPYNIRTNSVNPTVVWTDMGKVNSSCQRALFLTTSIFSILPSLFKFSFHSLEVKIPITLPEKSLKIPFTLFRLAGQMRPKHQPWRPRFHWEGSPKYQKLLIQLSTYLVTNQAWSMEPVFQSMVDSLLAN